MNKQTPGPLYLNGSLICAALNHTRALTENISVTLAEVNGPNRVDLIPEREANKELLAASYNAFDKAGRELGVDAAELARTIDLAEVIRYALDYAQLHTDAHDRKDVGRFDQVQVARHVVARVKKLMGVE